MAEYVHHQIGEEVRSIAGYYMVLEEGMLEYNGKKVLYLVEMAVVETSCCGAGGLGFILVPGYILKWKSRQDSSGLWISDVERITVTEEKREIENMLKHKYPHFYQVNIL
jgi:hypothetical protein